MADIDVLSPCAAKKTWHALGKAGTIVTTVMASSVFELVYGKKARESGELDAVPDTSASS